MEDEDADKDEDKDEREDKDKDEDEDKDKDKDEDEHEDEDKHGGLVVGGPHLGARSATSMAMARPLRSVAIIGGGIGGTPMLPLPAARPHSTLPSRP